MKIFLTGSTGFIGGHLLPKLQELGHDVVTDMRFFETEKFDLVIHLSAITNIKNEFDAWMVELNIVLAKKMLRTPYRTIYASSCSAAHLTNPYAWTKRYSEDLGQKHGNALGLRFHNVYGPRNNKGIVKFLMDQPNKEKITIRGPELIRDYIHVDDVVNYILYTIDENKMVGVVDVGTGVGTQTIDLVNLYRKLSGKSLIVDVTYGLYWENEPKEMYSNNIVPHMNLETGLKKLIDEQS